MAVSTLFIRKTVPGDAYRSTIKIAGDNSYPTGGYTVTPQMCGFSELFTDVLRCDPIDMSSGIYVPVIFAAYGADGVTIVSLQFKLEQYATAAEVTAGTNVSAATFYLITEGR